MTGSTVVEYRVELRPNERQVAILEAHAAYAGRVREWVMVQPDPTSVKKLHTAFKADALFDPELSGTVAERAIAGVVDAVEPPADALFNAADAARHGSKHVKVEDVAAVRRRDAVVKPAYQRLRLPKAGGVEIAGERIAMEGRAVREAWTCSRSSGTRARSRCG